MKNHNGATALTGTGRGLTLALLSAAGFGTSGTFGAALLDTGWSPGAAVTVRVMLAALLLTVPALASLRGRHRAFFAGWRSIVAFGLLAVAGAQLAYYSAVQTLSVAVALLLEYAGVLLVVLWLWAREGQKPRPQTVLGAGFSVVGLILVLQVLSGASIDPVGVLWGLAAAVGLAGYFVVSAKADDALPPLALAWGGLIVGGATLGLAGIIGVLPFAASTSDVTLVDRQVSWLVPVAGMVLLAGVVAYGFGVLAARALGATVASFVGLTEVLFAVGVSFLLLGQQLAGVQLVGGLLVVVGIVLVQADQKGTTRHSAATPALEMLTHTQETHAQANSPRMSSAVMADGTVPSSPTTRAKRSRLRS